MPLRSGLEYPASGPDKSCPEPMTISVLLTPWEETPEAKRIAQQELDRIGPLKATEKVLLFVFVTSLLHAQPFSAVSDQLLALLAKADHRFVLTIGPSVQFQHIVHAPSIFFGQVANALTVTGDSYDRERRYTRHTTSDL